MTCLNNMAGCPGVPHAPVSIVDATLTRDNNGPFTAVYLSDTKLAATIDFPEEGIYIIYNNRAIQIAGAPCEHRACERSVLCQCKDNNPDDDAAKAPFFANDWDQMEDFRPCTGCLLIWFRLANIKYQVQARSLKFYARPRTLTCVPYLGSLVLSYEGDSELDPSLDLAPQEGTKNDDNNAPPYLLPWMLEAWDTFIQDGGAVASLSGNDFAPLTSAHRSNPSDSDWDWHDANDRNTTESSNGTRRSIATAGEHINGSQDSVDNNINGNNDGAMTGVVHYGNGDIIQAPSQDPHSYDASSHVNAQGASVEDFDMAVDDEGEETDEEDEFEDDADYLAVLMDPIDPKPGDPVGHAIKKTKYYNHMAVIKRALVGRAPTGAYYVPDFADFEDFVTIYSDEEEEEVQQVPQEVPQEVPEEEDGDADECVANYDIIDNEDTPGLPFSIQRFLSEPATRRSRRLLRLHAH
ncbi:uncharacterized protein JN550_008045 [Neoarthrinium moseri]|uniref:uncharacterized protein n=1 Tax=Neoarthrinium moseri TaxID=1658444 RepID=UPI001FDB6C95|nr:uncharacterized protein JN550_008045 [Neoarthrinium moseri]KAI1866067.1 hypothetical protein JN550_008045 [Neoarthrinium moseri]